MASFAKAELLKYGWTEGKGLGKHENGIVDPLRPKLKFDSTGVGHDAREHKWWEAVYDKASSNINVDTSSTSVTLSAKSADAVEITTRKLDIKKLRKKHNMEYGSFLKTCTLDNGRVVQEEGRRRSALDEVLHEVSVPELTDEQLFEACGGRTGHKGARHGLTLSGKLSRIAQQEAELLGLPAATSAEEWTEMRRKKKLKRKRRRSAAEIDAGTGNAEELPEIDANANSVVGEFLPLESVEARKKSKTAKRRERRRVEDLVQKLNSVLIVEDSRPEVEKSGRRAKPRRRREEASDEAGKASGKKTKRKNCERNDEEARSATKRPRTAPIEVVVLSDGSLGNADEDDIDKSARWHKREFTEVDRMNYRIEKKKRKRLNKTEKRRVERLSECLMAVNLCEDSVDSGRGEDLVESSETSRKFKKWKKHKKEKREKKIEEIIILEP